MDLEVSGYNAQYLGDPNDFWWVELVDDVAYPAWARTLADGAAATTAAAAASAAADVSEQDEAPRVRALTTRFRLRHVGTGCHLRSAPLPLLQGRADCARVYRLTRTGGAGRTRCCCPRGAFTSTRSRAALTMTRAPTHSGTLRNM
jgi:hypothetical protein